MLAPNPPGGCHCQASAKHHDRRPHRNAPEDVKEINALNKCFSKPSLGRCQLSVFPPRKLSSPLTPSTSRVVGEQDPEL